MAWRKTGLGRVGQAATLQVRELQIEAVPVDEPRVQVGHGVGTVLRVQQQVEEPGIAARDVVAVQLLATLEPVAGGQGGQHGARIGDLLGFVGDAGIEHAQQCLQLVDAGATVEPVHENRHRTVVREHRQQCLEARIGIGEVVQDTDAVHVVEAAEVEPRQIEQRGLHEADAPVIAVDRGAPSRDVDRRTAHVEVDDLGVGVAQLVGEEDAAVAGTSACDQYPEARVEPGLAAKAVVVEDVQVVEPRGDDPHALLLGIAWRIRVALVLGPDAGRGVVGSRRIGGTHRAAIVTRRGARPTDVARVRVLRAACGRGSSALPPWRPRCSARRREWRRSRAALAQHAEVPLLVRRLEQERERHLEDVGHLDRIGDEFEWGLDPAHDRPHRVAGHGFIARQFPQDRDGGGRQSDFLPRLAQCGGDRARRRPDRCARPGS